MRASRLLRVVALGLMVMLCELDRPVSAASSASADVRPRQKLALVVGNNQYPSVPLRNPENDARDMASALKARGFQVTEAFNVTHTVMQARLNQFSASIRPGDLVLFYYAGHGVQVQGRNFLIPVDVAMRSEDEVISSGLDIGAAIDKFARAGAWMNIVVLDACRNNPFGVAKGAGLAAMDAPRGTLIAFATAPGKSAFDGEGRNGLYTKHLIANIPVEGLKIEEMMKRVRMGVAEESRGRQIPWENTSLTDDFYFTPGASGRDKQKASAQNTREATDAREAVGSAVASRMRNYLRQYPNGEHRTLVETALISAVEKEPLRLAAAKTYARDCPDCPEMVDMGSARGGAIGAFLITVYQYQQCVAAGACDQTQADEFGAGYRPAINVSYQDALKYAAWVSKKAGKKYRLPSQSEWLAAARMGQTLESPAGPQPLPQIPCESFNGYDRSSAFVSPFPWREQSCNDGFPFTSPVALFQPNALGMYDMIGNVWQWTSSCEGPKPAARFGACPAMVLKGGSWASPASSLNAESELVAEPGLAGNTIGFRLFRERR